MLNPTLIGDQRWHVKVLAEEVVPNAKCNYGHVCFLYEDPPVSCPAWFPLWWIYSAKIHSDPYYIYP